MANDFKWLDHMHRTAWNLGYRNNEPSEGLSHLR